MTVYVVTVCEQYEGIVAVRGVATDMEAAEEIVRGVTPDADIWVEVDGWSGEGRALVEGRGYTYRHVGGEWRRTDL